MYKRHNTDSLGHFKSPLDALLPFETPNFHCLSTLYLWLQWLRQINSIVDRLKLTISRLGEYLSLDDLLELENLVARWAIAVGEFSGLLENLKGPHCKKITLILPDILEECRHLKQTLKNLEE